MTVTATESELTPIKQAVIAKLAPQLKIPGFRSGNVPVSMAEKHLDANALQNQVLEEAVTKLYGMALDQEELRPVDRPEISVKKFVPYTDLEFEAQLTVIGTLTLPDYTKITLKKPEVTVTDTDVNEVIDALRKRAADRLSVDRPAKTGDEVTIDFVGKDDKDEPIKGADGTDYPLLIGSNAFIPGFEDNLIGLKPAEEKTFTIPFPKDYSVKALQGKKVTFGVTIKSVNEVVEPKADDEFASKVGPFKDLKELKKDIKERVLGERQQEADRAYENDLLKKIAEKTTVTLPDVLIDEQIDRIEQDEIQNLLYRGQTFEEHLKEEGVSHQEHRAQKRAAAEERVKIGLILSEIAEREKLTVTPQEFDMRLEMMRAQFNDAKAREELAKPAVQRDIIAQILTEKTLAKLVGYAKKA